MRGLEERKTVCGGEGGEREDNAYRVKEALKGPLVPLDEVLVLVVLVYYCGKDRNRQRKSFRWLLKLLRYRGSCV